MLDDANQNQDELMLLSQAAAMGLRRLPGHLRVGTEPGIRENEVVALANKRLYEMGSDQVEAIKRGLGERCNPHPHNFTDRASIRPR